MPCPSALNATPFLSAQQYDVHNNYHDLAHLGRIVNIQPVGKGDTVTRTTGGCRRCGHSIHIMLCGGAGRELLYHLSLFCDRKHAEAMRPFMNSWRAQDAEKLRLLEVVLSSP